MYVKIFKQCFWLNEFGLCRKENNSSRYTCPELTKCEYKAFPKKCPYYRHPDWKIKF